MCSGGEDLGSSGMVLGAGGMPALGGVGQMALGGATASLTTGTGILA